MASTANMLGTFPGYGRGAADHMWRFLGDVWANLPRTDRDMLSEVWKSYEQVFADILQQAYEFDFSHIVEKCPVFMTRRWLKYTFDFTSQIKTPVTFTAPLDISAGVDLSERYILAFTVDGHYYEIDIRGAGDLTSAKEIAAKINSVLKFSFVSVLYENAVLKFTSKRNDDQADIRFEIPRGRPDLNCADLVLGLTNSQLNKSMGEYRWTYDLRRAYAGETAVNDPESTYEIWHIPELINGIRTESVTVVLAENTDYIIDPQTQIIAFQSKPYHAMYARVTKIYERSAAYNFGWLINYVDNKLPPDVYNHVLKGLWFCYWMGGRPEFIRSALCLLFGLPVAREEGTVVDIGKFVNYFTEQTITVANRSGREFEYTVPMGLRASVKVGDRITRFQPLSTGVEVYDSVNRPGFVKRDLGAYNIARFLTPNATDADVEKALEMLENNTFLPQINVNAFTREGINLRAIRKFLDAIKPLHKTYHMQMIVAEPEDPINIKERRQIHIELDVSQTLDSNIYRRLLPRDRAFVEAGVVPPGTVDPSTGLPAILPVVDLDAEDICFHEWCQITTTRLVSNPEDGTRYAQTTVENVYAGL